MKIIKITYRLVSLLAVCLFVAPAFAQPDTAPNKTDAQGRKQGEWKKYYPEGTPQYEGKFKDNKPVGEFIRYFEDGSVQAKINYAPDGVERAKIFYPGSEVVMAQGNYINQKKDSIWLFHSATQVLTSSESYRNDEKNGITTIYYSDGSVSEKIEFKDGVKNGEWLQYFDDGTLKLSANVVEGVKYVGEFTSYYPNGSKLQTGKYVDGLKHSSWYNYHEDGSIEIIYVYRFGKVTEEHPQNGVFDAYFPNDIKRYEYTFKNGKKNGVFREYYNKGEWITKEEVDNFGNAYPIQKLEGIQIRREGNYKDGELNGELKYYTESGKLEKTETYNMGKLLD